MLTDEQKIAMKREMDSIVKNIEWELLIRKDYYKTAVRYRNRLALQNLLLNEIMKMNYNVAPALGTAMIIA